MQPLLLSGQTSTESINGLKQRHEKVKEELKKLDENLTQNRLTIKQTQDALDKINGDIKQRSAYIEQQTKKIAAQDNEIDLMNKEMRKMEENYDLMKQKYVDLIYHAYLRNNSYNRLLFVLSASSFQESYRRFCYLQQFAALRKQQAEDIEAAKNAMSDKKEKLSEKKAQSELLLTQKEAEQNLLQEEKQRQDKLVVSLQEREKALMKEVEKQQKAANDLNKKIQELIEKEAREAEKRKKAKAATKGGYAMTQEEKVIAGGFEKNKGYLMWPVQGTVTGHFGVQSHPVLKHVTIDNKGVYITASKGSEAAAVYDGVVTQCFSIPGSNNAVIVRHGNYLTVYANLTTLYVKAGNKVARGKKLGKIYEDADNNNQATILFQIRKEKEILNPEIWLKNK